MRRDVFEGVSCWPRGAKDHLNEETRDRGDEDQG